MEYPTFIFKPRGTKWIGCEFEVAFDCATEPELCSDPKIRITGLQSVGFIVSHEYEIEAPNIISVEEETGEPTSDCANPKRYLFTLSYRLHDKIGFGINVGPGTGTFGHRFRSAGGVEPFRTETICCDRLPKQPERAAVERHPRLVVDWLPQLGFLTFGAMLFGLAWIYFMLQDIDARRVYLLGMTALVAASGANALWRRATLYRWTRYSKPDARSEYL